MRTFRVASLILMVLVLFLTGCVQGTVVKVSGKGDLVGHYPKKEGVEAPPLGCADCHPIAKAAPGQEGIPSCAVAPATPCEKCPPPAPCLSTEVTTVVTVTTGTCPAGGIGGLPAGAESLANLGYVLIRLPEPQGKTWKSIPQSVSQEGGALLSLVGTTSAFLYRYPGSGGATYLSWYTGKQTGYHLITIQGYGETAVVGEIPAGIKADEALQIDGYLVN